MIHESRAWTIQIVPIDNATSRTTIAVKLLRGGWPSTRAIKRCVEKETSTPVGRIYSLGHTEVRAYEVYDAPRKEGQE